jgi:hypothetical protein
MFVCPRCGEVGLERFKTHSFCVNCNYEEISTVGLVSIPEWALKACEESGAQVRNQKPVRPTRFKVSKSRDKKVVGGI